MPDRIPGLRGPGRRRRVRPKPRRSALRVIALATAGAAVLGGLGLGLVYFKLSHNINGVDINAELGAERPEDVDNGSMDILLLGSDSRSGENGAYGRDEGSSRSDTAMIVHIAKGHQKATVVSIPRDTLVYRPSCTKPDGTAVPAQSQEMFNDAYSVGGPACAVKTVEAMTGIRMDHYLEVDFTGFKNMINAMGGVPVTTTKPINDPSSRLDLAAGTHKLDGEQALGLVRTRHGIGDGSDLGRIELQQAFVKALMAQANSLGTLTNPAKLYAIADTATKSLTTDSDLASVNSLINLAESLKSIKAGDLHMVTMPVRYDQTDPNRVVPLTAQARQVWDALKADRPVPASATLGSAGDNAGGTGVIRP